MTRRDKALQNCRVGLAGLIKLMPSEGLEDPYRPYRGFVNTREDLKGS